MSMIRPETEMKDSGIEWIGDIPESWTIRPLKSLYTLTTGFTPNSKDDSLYDENGETWVTIGDLKGDIIYNSKQKISKKVADMHRAEMTKQGSLMYSFKLSVGTVAVAGKDLFTNEAIASFLPKNRHGNLHYLKYASSLIIGNANTNIYGAFIMNQQLILNAPLPLPSLDEQQAIADYLDETCSKIDEIIAEAKASIDEYKELKQSVIFETVTKGLDKNVEMKDSGVKAIGKVNNKYNVAKIAELNDGLTDGTHGTYERFDSGKLLLSSKNVQHNGLVIGNNESYISEEDSNSIVANGFPQKNDLLLCCIGASIGRCILYPFDYPIAFQRSVIFIRCNKWILPKMMMYNLQSTSSLMQEQMVVNVSAQAGLYQGLVKQLYVTVPPIGEQEKIILFLDKKTAEIDSLIAEKESLINDLEAYKKSLIYEVVTGKRRVV